MRKVLKKLAVYGLSLVAGMASVVFVSAQNDPPYSSLLQGDSIKAGKVITVQDTVFFNPILKPTILRTNAINNIISFRINEYSNRVLPDSFKADIKIRLIYINKDNLQDSVTEKTLSIDYNKNKTYKSKDIYYLQGAYQMKVKVLQITATYASINTIVHSLELENKLQIERDYVMNPISGSLMSCSANAIRQVSKDVSTIPEYGELKISWLPNRTVESYDVEWAYIDKSALDNGRYNVSGQLSPQLIFKNNATRITTTADNYMIPLLYDGEGSLFFRVRGVQEDPGGELITTSWSSDFISDGGLGRYDFTGHERNLNWQATTSFAEDAKRKSVVQYFDGSLRNRQTVTRDNTTQTTVVAETLYDKQGRPVIQILPSPTLSKLIGYTPNFNVVNMNGSEYDKGIYDTLLTISDYCDKGADSMSVSSGVNRYYSSNNPLKDESFHQFISDAKGYAFVETIYSQDNTGRINKQGGVGKDFKIGSGHETKYLYATPEQTDLDALFGTEAGEASHYQKNMVRDANGQYSVSYVDMHGRTVATALAGTNPSSLQRLNSYRDSIQTEILLNKTNNVINGTSIESSKSLLVSKADSLKFHYGLASESLTLQDCQQRGICYDCLYDLTITITDDCNNQLLGGSSLVITKSNFKLFEIDTTCALAKPLNVDTTFYLQEGSYNISKILSISREGMQYYKDSIYLKHNTCLSYEDILKEQKEIVRNDISCDNSIETPFEYQTYRRDMELDLYPLIGQYADTAIQRDCSFSIFNSGSLNTYRDSRIDYRDEDGSPVMVMNEAGNMVAPQQLTIEEFILNFNRSWAASMIIIHPEYALLTKYESFSASHQWEEDFAKTETYSEAKMKGYLNPTGNTIQQPASSFPNTNPDPLYSSYPESNLAKQNVEGGLFNTQTISGVNISVWGLATSAAKCPNTLPIDQSCVIKWNQTGYPFNEDSLCEGDLDMAWKFFRSQYLTKKHEWLISYIKSSVGTLPAEPLCFHHFSSASELLQQGGLNQTQGDSLAIQNQAAAFYADNCKAYATRWWEQIQTSCNYYAPSDSSVIIPYLIEVCKQGSDIDHPYGSSSVKPGSSYRFKNFEEVIKFYNDSTGRSTNIDCNSYLIDKPLPYNQSVPLVRKPLFGKPEPCECEKINTYYTEYASKISLYGTFSNFMLQKYKTTISEGALDTLRNLCSGIIPCKYLPKPIYLPTLFQCIVDQPCANCTTVQQLYDSFLVKFPGHIPTKEEPDTIQQKINRIFTTYMNQQLGFSKSCTEYLDFMDTCRLYVPSDNVDTLNNNADTLYVAPSGIAKPSSISCTILINTYKNFLADYPDPSKGGIVKVFVPGGTQGFSALSLFSAQENTNQIVDSIPALPDSIQQSPQRMAEIEAANNSVQSNISLMSLAAALPGMWVDSLYQCKRLFEWYFNNHLNTSGYTYENFTDWLVNSCHYKINQLPCDDKVYVSCDTLQQLKNLFEQRYPSASGDIITETISIPVHKVTHIGRRFLSNGTFVDEFSSPSGASIAGQTWTSGGYWFNTRDNISFDFRALPSGAYINDASLNLYAKPDHLEYFPCCGAHYRVTSQNIFGIIERATDLVIPGKTLWNNQPATDPINGITLAPLSVRLPVGSSSDFFSNEDYLSQHCTLLARSLHGQAWQNKNYGVLFRLNMENINNYKSYTFWGITSFTPAGKQPNLSVNYTANRCDVFTAFVNTHLGTHLTSAQVQNLYAQKCGELTTACGVSSSSCDVSYQKIYKPYFATEDTTGFVVAKDIVKNKNGGFVIAGEYSEFANGDGGVNSFLMSTDAKGNVLWSKSYTGEIGLFKKIKAASDGGYVVLSGYRLSKVDGSGNIQWIRQIPDSTFGLGDFEPAGHNLLTLSNGDYTTISEGRGQVDDSNSVYLNFANFSASGNLKITTLIKLASGANTTFNPEVHNLDIAENGDSVLVSGTYLTGNYVINGGHQTFEEKSFIIKFSRLTGQASALRMFSSPAQSIHFSGLKKTITGDYILTAEKGLEGGVNPKFVIVKLDQAAKFLEVKSSAFTGAFNFDTYPIKRLLDVDDQGNYYSAYNDPENHYVKLSRNGTSLPYDKVLINNQLAGDLTTTSGLQAGIVAGRDGFAFIGTNNYGNIVLVKVNKEGNTGCDSNNFQNAYLPDTLIETINPVITSVVSPVSRNFYLETRNVRIVFETTCSTEVCPSTNNGPLLCGKTESLNEPFEYFQEDPCADSTTFAIITATERERIYKDSLAGAFEEAYQQKCLNAINLETFTVSHPVSEYHYTLYYYDLAGNLIKTVPPEGVHPNRDPQWLQQVVQKRESGEWLAPAHTLTTTYRYNSLNQIVTQKSPDGGYGEFWYDRLGRLAVSRNAKQKLEGKYSYTLYDPLGRITEVGQKQQATLMTNTLARSQTQLSSWLRTTYFNANGLRCQAERVTTMVYDIKDDATQLPMPIPVNQKAYTLRNRVSYIRTYEFLFALGNGTPRYAEYEYSTTYSYDIHGNVDTLMQQYRTGLMAAHGNNRFKVMAYKYDLISGNVNQVHYQPGQADQLYHRYEYDAENRLTDVYTSDNKMLIGDVNLEEHEAHNDYYKHGPLARTVLGQQQVQGIDYAYTLQGWLKGVNSTGLSPDLDMGNDGKTGVDHKIVARDAYSFNLNYFTSDYSAISGKNMFPGHSGYMPAGENRELFNGNISSMAVNIGKFNQPQLYNYQYDQLNRLVAMNAYRGFNTANNNWSAIAVTQEYKERISYDGNGNILSYLRNGTTAGGKQLGMDNLLYGYNKDVNGNIINNRLRHVKDDIPLTGNYTEDIDNEGDDNYTYDAIGNLIGDNAEKITNIQWNVYGKILSITKTATTTGDVRTISYTYDAAGNRISKRVEKLNQQDKYTWYVRDASGNVMAVYEYDGTVTSTNTLYLKEQHLYGSSRLAVWNRNINMDVAVGNGTVVNLLGPTFSGSFERGNKFFELTNHLGNVLVTLSDKKIGISSNGTTIDYYEANVVTANDYYPFGMQMPGRKHEGVGEYRYGFNGKEKDNETYGQGNEYDYGFRIYNPRLGRFLSVDPLTQKYPMLTPYQFASNMPTIAIDIDGEEAKVTIVYHSRYNPGTVFDRVTTTQLWLVDSKEAQGEIFFRSLFSTWPQGHWEVHKYPTMTSKGVEYKDFGNAIFVPDGVNFQTGRVDLTGQTLGLLSEHYEAGGVGTVSTGKGDHGGVSYGSWQLATNMGSPEDFLDNEGSKYKAEFGKAQSGTKEFSKIWKNIAAREPEAFKNAQHAFIKRRDYDQMVSNVKQYLGIDINSRSSVLQDVVWSTAVQHGGASNVLMKALKGQDVSKLSDADIIKLVYAERGRKDSNGNLVRFSSSSKEVQQGVSARYKSEMKEALQKLGN